ncbi:MAG: hypothetical protein HY617_04085 [Candidatus Sungbacteria bacterium]|nr:hypothetical protein [Candidatus Sungbacteria bacterium]
MLELVIYVGMLSVFMVLIIATLMRVVRTYDRVRAQRSVVSNGRLVIEQLMQQISGSQAIYSPTSVFGSNAGQLSIVTPVGASSEETVNHIDFWLDNGRVWMRKEGAATTSVTSPSVRVNQMRFDQISQGLGREAVVITLQITGFADAQFTASSTLHAAAALRGTY